MRRLLARLRNDEGGSPLLEFAMVLPIVVLMTLGAVEMGFVYITYGSMVDAARDAARQLARGSVTPGEAETLARSRLMLDRPYVITAQNGAGGDVSVHITLPLTAATATRTMERYVTITDLDVTVVMRKEV